VAKVTTSGVFTEYPIPTASSIPRDITAGPDGNLWFTEVSSTSLPSSVAKVTTSGAVTEYPIPAAGSDPAGIVAGPDGKLWFTEAGALANSVANVTTGGLFTEYPVPTANSSPWDIAAGPDGNLWFTETFANNVASVTTSGVITEYPIPTANSYPYDIAAGPDGNLWLTESAVANVARVTTSGVVSEYATPTGITLLGIAAGPDGNVWVAEYSPAQVAKVSTTGGPSDVDLSITKTDSPDPVVAHNELTYVISVSNLAPSADASGVMVTDTLPAHVMFGSATTSQGTCITSKTKGATTVTCNLGTVANGASATVTLVVKPIHPDTITNTATVTSSVTDRDLTNNTAQQVTTVLK